MKNKKTVTLLLTAFSLAAFSSCETTGDPNKSGYLGYSQDKNDARRAEMARELAIEKDKQADLKAERSRLQAKLAAKKRERDSIISRRDQLDAQPIEDPQATRALENELAAVESEIRVLQATLSDLMD